VDRFFEKNCKEYRKYGNTSIVDLLILSTAKYLIDFYGLPKKDLYIITQDDPLYKLAKSYADLPMVFNPSVAREAANKIFVHCCPKQPNSSSASPVFMRVWDGEFCHFIFGPPAAVQD